MSSDSIAVSGSDKFYERNGKIIRKDFLLIGYVGKWRAGQLLEVTEFKYLRPAGCKEAREFLIKQFVPFLQGLAQKEPEQFTDAAFLVVCNGRCFRIYPQSGQVVESVHDYDAIGCGAQIALGAMYAGATSEGAIAAAEEFCTDVGGPIITISSGKSLPREED